MLEAAARRFDISFSWQHFDWNCKTYLKTGRMVPAAGFDQLRPFDAIYSVRSAIRECRTTSHGVNPIAQIWSGAMMLDHLGEPKAARAVEQAILRVLANSFVRTRDIGGNASTREIGEQSRPR